MNVMLSIHNLSQNIKINNYKRKMMLSVGRQLPRRAGLLVSIIFQVRDSHKIQAWKKEGEHFLPARNESTNSSQHSKKK